MTLQCVKCDLCKVLSCPERVAKPSFKKELQNLSFFMMFTSGIADTLTIMALYFFVIGSTRQDNSWGSAWDAYRCSQMVFPTSVLVAVITCTFLLGFLVWVYTKNTGE